MVQPLLGLVLLGSAHAYVAPSMRPAPLSSQLSPSSSSSMMSCQTQLVGAMRRGEPTLSSSRPELMPRRRKRVWVPAVLMGVVMGRFVERLLFFLDKRVLLLPLYTCAALLTWWVRERAVRRWHVRTLMELAALSDRLNPPPQSRLSQQLSLTTAAPEVLNDFGRAAQSRGAGEAFERLFGEVGAAVNDLGRAAQEGLSTDDARDSLTAARARAQAALKELNVAASVVVEAAGEVSDSGGSRKLDIAWRRDALRALLALEAAPAQLQREWRRQSLAKLSDELAVLGLAERRPESLTLGDIKAARGKMAKELHPDIVGGGGGEGGRGGGSGATSMEDLNEAYARCVAALNSSPMMEVFR